MAEKKKPDHGYTEDSIRSLDWKEHIRTRPGMYIGKLGDGTSKDDGIYVLLKEVIDNSIDEHVMGYGKAIEINIQDGKVEVCLLYTSDAADERSSVDLGGRRIIKKKKI